MASNFPLPEGYCRQVCRAKGASRPITPSVAVRMVRAALNNGYTQEEVCEAIAKAGLSCKRVHCDRAKQIIDTWLEISLDMKEHTGFLDDFLKDLLPSGF